MMYDQESEVVQWGLRLFDCDSSYNSNGYYHEIVEQDDASVEHQACFSDEYDGHVENDEVIARTLQEEFSKLAMREADGYSNHAGECFQEPVISHDWHGPRDYYSGHQYGNVEFGGCQPSNSYIIPSQEECSRSLVWPENCVSDGEESERMNQMVFIPHVPRINGDIPSTDEATSDHQRLLDRLQLYDFVESKVQGDGNCQFRALSDQLYQTEDQHEYVRKQIVNQLRLHPEAYEGYVPMGYDDYLEKMSKSGEWGDHVTLQAAADSFGVKIFLMTSFKDTCCIEIVPNFNKSKEVIFLSFWAEVHYNSIRPQGGNDLHLFEDRKKKRWWMFNAH